MGCTRRTPRRIKTRQDGPREAGIGRPGRKSTPCHGGRESRPGRSIRLASGEGRADARLRFPARASRYGHGARRSGQAKGTSPPRLQGLAPCPRHNHDSQGCRGWLPMGRQCASPLGWDFVWSNWRRRMVRGLDRGARRDRTDGDEEVDQRRRPLPAPYGQFVMSGPSILGDPVVVDPMLMFLRMPDDHNFLYNRRLGPFWRILPKEKINTIISLERLECSPDDKSLLLVGGESASTDILLIRDRRAAKSACWARSLSAALLHGRRNPAACWSRRLVVLEAQLPLTRLTVRSPIRSMRRR